jgi:hypothetical protein
MTQCLFADALLARGLSACGLKEADVVDPLAALPMPYRNAVFAHQSTNRQDMTQTAHSANPTAWHVLLNTH